MILPNLPTDNLYKFIALSGIIILLLSITTPQIMLNKIADNIIEEETELRRWQLEIEFLKEERQFVTDKMALVDSMRSKYNLNIDEQANISTQEFIDRLYDQDYRNALQFFYNNREKIFPSWEISNEIIKQLNDLSDAYKQIRLKKFQIDRNFEIIKKNKQKTITYWWLFIVGTIIGLIMSFFGFYFWYVRVQKYLDKKLYYELKIK